MGEEIRFFRSLGWTHIVEDSVLLALGSHVFKGVSCLIRAEGQGDIIVFPAHIPRKNIQRKRQKTTRAIPAMPFRLR
ncbi:MAG: hypothetical protein D3909_14940 [Candidatus Electrothrix sp. ATG1]|nr:hypothetical protein [Candidatus Electrothrix sp. ATG1]